MLVFCLVLGFALLLFGGVVFCFCFLEGGWASVAESRGGGGIGGGLYMEAGAALVEVRRGRYVELGAVYRK